jgi:oxygen-independent coproporphyrinogen-3 oxidase
MNVEIDLDLILKYNRPGPRYTSYPTALQFQETVDKEAIYTDMRDSTDPLSLYFHIPFCEKLCWFCACNTIITKNHNRAGEYLDMVDKEAAFWVQKTDRRRPVEQVHLGGGSPSYLTPDQIYKLGSIIHTFFSVQKDAECSIEIDPRSCTREKAEALKAVGFNRVSMGIQDSNSKVQKAINRVQSRELNSETIHYFRELGFKSINMDLIYGLPYQTPATIRETIHEILELNPDRIATFNYAHVPWMKPAQKLLERTGALPQAPAKLEMLEIIIDEFTAAGYRFIGMDHFAKEEDSLTKALDSKTLRRNFQGYSTRAGLDILAMGVSSISQTERTYFQNYKEIDTYRDKVEGGNNAIQKGYVLTDEDIRRREIIMRLMCDFELNYDRISKLIGEDFSGNYSHEIKALEPMREDGLLEISPKQITVTPKGRLLIRNIAMHFDAYLKSAEGRHSKTI